MKKIVILISGGGSNMAAIVRCAQREGWRERLGAEVAAVISNRADAGGLTFAREQGIATEVLDHKQFTTQYADSIAIDGGGVQASVVQRGPANLRHMLENRCLLVV